MRSEIGQTRTVTRGRRLAAGILLALAVAVVMAGCGGGDGDSEGRADIVIDNRGFQPDELDLKVGEEVSFTVENRDSRDHTFTLTFLDIDTPVPAGEEVTIKLKTDEVPRDGFFSFYSKDHQVDGYFGRINVEA